MGLLLVMAMLVIYMVLGILYESFIHPLTILSGLPSAGLGALLTLLIFHDELNIYSFVGIIMLIGIVKKNAIMMIDFALEAQRTHGMSPGRCDRRSLPGPLPSHHDDHHGGADGHAAHRAGLGRRRRSAASAGTGGRRRPGGFAVADALHHAGDSTSTWNASTPAADGSGAARKPSGFTVHSRRCRGCLSIPNGHGPDFDHLRALRAFHEYFVKRHESGTLRPAA